MKRSLFVGNQRGAINVLIVPLVASAVLLLIAVVFGAWAFSSRADYKNNVEAKITIAEKAARADEDIIKDKEHSEADKQPLKTYKGPDQFGGVGVSYPKTWSGYVVSSETGSSGTPLDGYFHPNVVPGLNDKSAAYALRVQVVGQQYAAVINKYNSDVKNKKLTATPFAFKNVPKTVGVRFDGSLGGSKNLTGSIIAIPIRDKTLLVSTESPQFMADFNNLILPSITFSP